MKRLDLIVLFMFGVAVTISVSCFKQSPGYMDAEYYLMTGIQLFEGKGFSEPVIWNYLNQPTSIPQPSHQYWLPGASVLAWAGMAIFNSESFWAARSLFILLAGLLPIAIALLAYNLTGKRSIGWLSGALSIASGYYAVYMGITDTFVIYMCLGAIFFWLFVRIEKQPDSLHGLFLGIVCGMLSLTRVDGVGFWAVAIVFLIWKTAHSQQKPAYVKSLLGVIGGMLLVTTPWLIRNQVTLSTWLPSGGSRTLWLENYNQMFRYDPTTINVQNWLLTGWAIIIERVKSLGSNLLTSLMVHFQIILLPFAAIGIRNLQKIDAVRLAGVLYVGLLLGLTVLFPFASSRGGFFHSAAAIQPVIWILAAVGIESFVGSAVGKARVIFTFPRTVGLVLVTVAVSTIFLSFRSVVGGFTTATPGWDAHARHYQAIDAFLDESRLYTHATVMVKNPPGFWLASRQPAIVIPDGGVQDTLAAARQFGARILILEKEHTSGLEDFYRTHRSDGLTLLEIIDTTQIYLIEAP